MSRRWLPLVIAMIVVFAAFFAPRYDALHFEQPHAMSVASAQALLSAISSGMITLTAIVFSLAFLILQFTVSSYSARVAPLLTRDPVLFDAFAIFVATFAYALGTLASTDFNGNGIVPQLSIGVVSVLLAGSVAMLVRLIQRLNRLQIYNVLRYLHDEGCRIVERLPPLDEVAEDITEEPAVAERPTQVVPYFGARPKYITRIDREALHALSAAAGGTIVISCAVGDCVGYGTVLARAYGTTSQMPTANLLRAFLLADERSLQRDLPYAMRLLVDTAIRGLSPAINDPTTAVQALDELEDLLCRLSRRSLPPGSRWDGYLHLAFDEIRLCAAEQPLVYRRMRAAIMSLLAVTPVESRRAAVRAHLLHLDESIARAGFDERDEHVASRADRQGLGVSSEVWT